MTSTSRSTPRSTKFRVQTSRLPSNGTPESHNISETAQLEKVEASEESQWEDVLEPQNEAQTPSKDPANPISLRRPPTSNPRRRKRTRSGLTLTDKLPTSGVTTGLDAGTPLKDKIPEKKYEESPQQETFGRERKSPVLASKEQVQTVPIFSKEDLVDGALQCVSFSSRYIFDVCQTALALLRKPLGFLLFLFVLASLLSNISHFLRNAFAPICWVPFISSTFICQPTLTAPLPTVNYPVLMEAETRTFEQLLDEASGGSVLSLEVKKAEMATSDLVTLVHLSSLTSKETLARMLLDFVEDAKKTGRRLQKLHAKVSGSVDTIMAVNDYALRTIEKANEKRSFFAFDIIPWVQNRKVKLLKTTFDDAMDTLASQVERLIIEAEANIYNLNELEERLVALNELVSREDRDVQVECDDLLASLWTKLGAHRKELKNFNKNFAILKNIKTYRNQARVHVTATLQALQSLGEDMIEIRDRVAAPGLIGERIPLEVQMKSIQFGIDRLKENRLRARQNHEAAIRAVTGLGLNEIDA